MKDDKEFLDAKKRAMESLEKAYEENKADEKILPILDLINSLDEYYTSSSCSGRVVLLEIPSIGDKKNARFLGKWHREIKIDDMYSAVEKAKTGVLWLLAQSPIIHLGAKSKVAADRILKTAISRGFKNSGLKSISGNIIVEVCSTERLDSPVGRDGKLFCNDEYLSLLVKIANDVLKRSSNKLQRFEEDLKKYLSTHKTTQ